MPVEFPVLLAVSSDPRDPELLESNLHGWRVQRADNCSQALAILSRSSCDVILCERDLPDGCWRDLLNGLGALRDAMPLVVMSAAADESMWAEVLREGGFDLLAKPLETDEVRRVVPTARVHSSHRQVATHA